MQMLLWYNKVSVDFPKCSRQIESSSVESLLADRIIFNDYFSDSAVCVILATEHRLLVLPPNNDSNILKEGSNDESLM